jgi:N-acetylmuramoyl-L-alanine amidase
MEIKNNLLFKDNSQVEYIQSPNTNGQSRLIVPSYVIIHYTADSSMEGAIDWFKNPVAEASAHLVIGRDGRIVQMVPFNQRAWHAGNSSWGNIVGLNSYSVGIELVNAGKLVKKQGNYVNWAGHVIPEDEVIQAIHKNETSPCFWHEYTQAQFDAAIEVSKALVSTYSILEILGHDDIAPGRKTDPGPAFPMSAFTSRVFGRA